MSDDCNQRYVVRNACTSEDMRAALALRATCFRQGADDSDAWDDLCTHIIVEDAGRVVCTFRMLFFENGTDVAKSYAAKRYDLSNLSKFEKPMIEVGRFCICPSITDPDVLRTAWAALTRMVDENAVGLLFGCSSFTGTDVHNFKDAFAVLQHRHLAPDSWHVSAKGDSVALADAASSQLDRKSANAQMPALLKTYLSMGGWVSDHAVLDHDLGTTHVFTAVEIAAIPPARARALRQIANSLPQTAADD
mgnify:CR=1 FL=1